MLCRDILGVVNLPHYDDYMVCPVVSQGLFQSPGTIMGHVVRSRGTDQRSTELLRCLQEMPQTNCANTCHTGGMVKLEREDELELVIPDRPQAQVSMEADSTFFGIMRLN
ncbi:tumor necrosis factor ligand superfamily member 13B-like [Oncorhynchus masou masou]|uniref:tumor necrosis factor ligand superfamily member 13B-like n=1 Tax=Oncorhynchus masou masou TaxID=90313 RepID=UPI003183C327